MSLAHEVAHVLLLCIQEGQGGGVIVKGAPDLHVGREARVQSRAAHHVQGRDRLWDESVPLICREGGVRSMKYGYAVVFHCLDGAFRGQGAVVSRRCELVSHVLCFNV